MSKIDTGGPAFPGAPLKYKVTDKGLEIFGSLGMTWLDECAMRAMHGILANTNYMISKPPHTDLAKSSYEIAQAMLTEKRRLEDKE